MKYKALIPYTDECLTIVEGQIFEVSFVGVANSTGLIWAMTEFGPIPVIFIQAFCEKI